MRRIRISSTLEKSRMKIVLIILFFLCCCGCKTQNKKQNNHVSKYKAVSVYLIDTKNESETIIVKDKSDIDRLESLLFNYDKTNEILKWGSEYRAMIQYKDNENKDYEESLDISGHYYRTKDGVFKSDENLNSICEDLIKKYK